MQLGSPVVFVSVGAFALLLLWFIRWIGHEPTTPELGVVILGLLADGELHGYQLTKLLKGQNKLGQGTLYLALHRMEQDGLIISSRRQEEGRFRRYYRITVKGLQVVK